MESHTGPSFTGGGPVAGTGSSTPNPAPGTESLGLLDIDQGGSNPEQSWDMDVDRISEPTVEGKLCIAFSVVLRF
jgi:hypothetical protein